MCKFLLSISLSLICFIGFTQEAQLLDSLKKELSSATTLEKKINLLDKLSKTAMNTDHAGADKYGNELIQIAESSRDRKAMAIANISNAERLGAWAGYADFTNRSMIYFEQAKKIAKDNKLIKYEIEALVKQANVLLNVHDVNKASQCIDQASSLSSSLNDDSTSIEIELSKGDIALFKNEKIAALRLYLSALRKSEQNNIENLKRKAYLYLTTFYQNIGDYEKSIDYFTLAMQSKTSRYEKVTDVKALGDLYAVKANYDMAIKQYELSIEMADSLQYPALKVPGYQGLLSVFIQMKQPTKSLEFLKSDNGIKLLDHFKNIGFAPYLNYIYGIIYTEMGNLDSAGLYFKKSESFFNSNISLPMKANGLYQYALYYKRKGAFKEAINLLLSTKSIGDSLGQLDMVMDVSKNLDTLYEKLGDYKNAKYYSANYFLYKDSLFNINKEKELLQVEAQDEQLRQVQAMEAEAEKKRQRNNIQYMAITIGIATLFLLMVIFGMFKVSATTIKLLGFFTFLMFFEFIFLIFKKNIYTITHGEPWKDLLFMIGLAAILLPLHHWLEHKVMHYLTSHNKLTTAGSILKNKMFRNHNKKA